MENTVHINRGHQVAFDLRYVDNVHVKALEQQHVKRARISLDLPETEAVIAELTSPNYPLSYPSNADIEWRVRVPAGYVVSLEIIDLDLEGCCDHLEVYDGLFRQESSLGRISGKKEDNHLNIFQSTSSSMSVRLNTTFSTSAKGFKAFASALFNTNSTRPTARPPFTTLGPPINATEPPPSDVCSSLDIRHANPHQTFILVSPNYPNSYYNNLNCTWLIQTFETGHVVEVTSVDVDLENCCDIATVHDGGSETSPPLGRLLTGINETFLSTADSMTLHFTTDYSVTAKGFKVLYRSVPKNSTSPITTPTPPIQTTSPPRNCRYNHQLYNGTGYIQSPNYPNNYFSNASCSWYIQGHLNDHVVKLNIQDMQIGYGDVLMVYDGESYEILYNFTYRNQSFQPIYSTSKSMYLTFVTDSYYESKGFRLQYLAYYFPQPQTTTPPPTTGNSSAVCAGLDIRQANSNQSFNLVSPNYPNDYGNNLNCSWMIYTVETDHVIELYSLDVDLESCCDYVAVHDGPFVTNTSLLGQLQNGASQIFYSDSNAMSIYFSTDYSVTGRGFNLLYRSVPKNTTSSLATTTPPIQTTSAPPLVNVSCYSERIAVIPYQNLTSVNYPNGYPNRLDCSWVIFAFSNRTVIELALVDVSLDDCCDVIRIHDGDSKNYPVLAEFKGVVSSNATFHSSGRYMFVNFATDDTSSGRGFHFKYRVVY